MANTILLSESDATEPRCPFLGSPKLDRLELKMAAKVIDESGQGVNILTKSEIEDLVEAAVSRALRQTLTVTLPQVVECSVTKAMNEYEHECLFDFSPPEVEAMQTLVDVMKSSGHGDVVRGVEEIRENLSFTAKMRRRIENASDAAAATIAKAIGIVLLSALGVGLAILLSKNGGIVPPTR